MKGKEIIVFKEDFGPTTTLIYDMDHEVLCKIEQKTFNQKQYDVYHDNLLRQLQQTGVSYTVYKELTDENLDIVCFKGDKVIKTSEYTATKQVQKVVNERSE